PTLPDPVTSPRAVDLLALSFGSLHLLFNGTATTEIYTLSLHDALPISGRGGPGGGRRHSRGPARDHRAARQRHPDVQHAAKNIEDRKSTRLNSSHVKISYAVFCLKKKKPQGS